MPRRQNWWEDGEGKETGMSNQATRQNVVQSSYWNGQGPVGPYCIKHNPFFSGSEESQEKFLERWCD